MRCQTQHHQIRIRSAHHVLRIRIVFRLAALPPNEVHDLVLTLAGHIRIGQEHLQVLPSRMVVQTIMNVVVQTPTQPLHERCSRRNAIRIEMLALRFLRRNGASGGDEFLTDSGYLQLLLGVLLGGAEATRTLLVHFGAWRHSVNGHVEDFAWPHDAEEAIDAIENGDHHFVLVLRRRFILRMRTRMYNAVHVEVEIVKLDAVRIGQCGVLGHPFAVDLFLRGINQAITLRIL